jgi:hypothetical protein
VFNDNGAGVRGDLKAVVRAILLDPEARGDVKLDPRLRQAARAGAVRQAAAARGQRRRRRRLFGRGGATSARTSSIRRRCSTTTRPTYVLRVGYELAPEFAIQNSSTVINRDNVANTLAFGTIAPLATYPARRDATDWSAPAGGGGSSNALADKLDATMLHGTMSPAMRAGLDRGRRCAWPRPTP